MGQEERGEGWGKEGNSDDGSVRGGGVRNGR